MTSRTLVVSRSVMDATLPFALPIGLSAFLLFSVEPLVGRLVLAVFGGTPAVWATILFFFQAVLLAGYLYGHISVTWFGRWGPPIHLAIAALGFVVLLSAPGRIAELRNAAAAPVLDLVGILISLIALPAFVLTATTPLLSGWFHAAREEEQGDPYWLYALSNAGSLLALLAYPLLIEPRLGLSTQRGVWAIGYAALVALIAGAAFRAMPDIVARRRRSSFVTPELPIGSPISPTRVSGAGPINWPRRLRWLLLAAVPSGLLTAVTNFIATDLVSAPLLWVIPLAIYLASFIVAFSTRGGRLVRLAALAVPAMATLMWVPYSSTSPWPILAVLAVELIAFAVVATGLHGRLALDRPNPAHLTEFYVILSTGGALASAFVAVVAPTLFPDIWEYPILLVVALVAVALIASPTAGPRRVTTRLDLRPFVAGFGQRIVPYAIGAAFLLALLVASGFDVLEPGVWFAIGGLLLLLGGRPWVLVAGMAVILVLATFAPSLSTEFRGRSFFGVTEVRRDGEMMVLMNGTTVHGTQWTDPARRRTPTTYYGQRGPAGDIFAVGADSSAVDPKRIGIVGLGAGTLAAYKDEWMSMTYFEIDPVVIRVAQDPSFFTYLSDAPGAPDIVEGDARLSLADEPDRRYDLLILDAFSSDSIPTHLLTLEAITDELRTVSTDGVIAFHISNRYYTLAPSIAAAFTELGMTTLERASRDQDTANDESLLPSRWLAASRNLDSLAAFRAHGWDDTTPADHPFTDDYADLLSYLHLGP